MTSFAGFSSAGFKPNIFNSVTLVGTEVDAVRMGGELNKVYFTAQAAYDAAVILTGSAGAVNIFVHETTAAQVGNISTGGAAFNTNISITGLSPIVSTIGNISMVNSAGAGGSFNPRLLANLTIGSISCNSTGGNGGGGQITIKTHNCILGALTTNANGSGNSGNITIATNSSSVLNRDSFITSITTSATGSANAGSVSITGGDGLKVGNITTSTGSNNGGSITVSECDTIGAVSCTTTGNGASVIISNCRLITSITITGTGSALTLNNCAVTGNVSFTTTGIVGNGQVSNSRIAGNLTISCNNGAPTHLVDNCTVDGAVSITTAGSTPISITRSWLKSTLNGNNTCVFSANNSTFTGVVSGMASSSNFRMCTFFGNSNSIASSCQFLNCVFAAVSGAPLIASSPVTVVCSNCTIISVGTFNSNVAIITEREYNGTVSTTDATPTNIFQINVPTGQRLRVIANISATTGTNSMMSAVANIIRNDAGTLTKIGGSDSVLMTPITEGALTTATVQISTSGTNALVTVTGVAATNISWTGSFKVFSSF